MNVVALPKATKVEQIAYTKYAFDYVHMYMCVVRTWKKKMLFVFIATIILRDTNRSMVF